MRKRVTAADRTAAATMEGLGIVAEHAAIDLERAGIPATLLRKTAKSYYRSAAECRGEEPSDAGGDS